MALLYKYRQSILRIVPQYLTTEGIAAVLASI